MNIIEILKVIFLGIVQGITEWLPASSTECMILVDEFLELDVTPEFMNLFLVFIQLGSILAVVVIYWERLIPLTFKGGIKPDKEKFSMWFKILVAPVPAGIVEILFDDVFIALFYSHVTVVIILILFGVFFIVIENYNKSRTPSVTSTPQIMCRATFWIGVFQMIAAVFPGTSRSGSTIVGALFTGISRTTATEFTFFLAILAMFGGSLLKLLKFGFPLTSGGLMILFIGMLVVYLVSMVVIKFLMGYIGKYDFEVFGWHRIVSGVIVLGCFFLAQ